MIGNVRKSLRRWFPIRWDATGNERTSGLPISLTYFGHNFGFHTTAGAIFEPGYTYRQTGRRWLGTPGLPITPRGGDGDIVGIELEPTHWPARDTGSGFYLPLWSRTEITVADACRQMKKSSSLKDDLRRIRKNRIVCETSHNTHDLHAFYEKMYLPYIQARHGELSLPDSWKVVAKTASEGELILARRPDGEPIGGIVLGRTPAKIYARTLGLINSDKAVMKTGVISALYLACFEHAETYGFDRVGFGLTGPFLNDGILRFKKKWGIRLLGEYGQGGVWLRFNRTTSSVNSFLTKNPFLHLSKNKLYGITFITNPESLNSEHLQKLHSLYYLPGMNSLQICTLNPSRGKLHIPEAIQTNVILGTDRRF